jgi:mycothiol synthase
MVPPVARTVTGLTGREYHLAMPPVAVRPPSPEDLEAVLEVILARDVADLGRPDYTLEDLRADWAQADLARDAWVAEDGGIAGYAILDAPGATVLVHPEAEGRGIGAELLARLERRARERGIGELHQDVAERNAAARRLLEAAGWRATQRYWRMRLELDARPSAPRWPPGAAVGPMRPGHDDAAVHALVARAFSEIEGDVPRSLEEWRKARARPGFDAALAHLAEVDGRLAGAAICERWAEGTGFVAELAVATPYRGRGLGRALLLASMEAFHARGLARAELGVHARNRTGVALYESVGMRPVFVVDRYDLRLDD